MSARYCTPLDRLEVRALLVAARNDVAVPGRWVKGYLALDGEGKLVSLRSREARQFCTWRWRQDQRRISISVAVMTQPPGSTSRSSRSLHATTWQNMPSAMNPQGVQGAWSMGRRMSTSTGSCAVQNI